MFVRCIYKNNIYMFVCVCIYVYKHEQLQSSYSDLPVGLATVHYCLYWIILQSSFGWTIGDSKKVYNLDASIMKNRPGMLKIITTFTHTHIYAANSYTE